MNSYEHSERSKPYYHSKYEVRVVFSRYLCTHVQDAIKNMVDIAITY